MINRHLLTGICVSSAFCALEAPAQDAVTDEAITDSGETEAAGEPVGGDAEECFDVTRSLDMDVLDDAHLYIRTFGANHYLVTMENSCRNLHRSHLAGGVRINPYGRRVCADDGSHIVYTYFWRESVCRIMRIDTVDGRAQAMAIVEEGPIDVQMEEITPPE